MNNSYRFVNHGGLIYDLVEGDDVYHITVQGSLGGPKTLEVPKSEFTRDQVKLWLRGGIHIQNALTDASADTREFLITGITPGEWDRLYGEPEDRPVPIELGGDDDTPF